MSGTQLDRKNKHQVKINELEKKYGLWEAHFAQIATKMIFLSQITPIIKFKPIIKE